MAGCRAIVQLYNPAECPIASSVRLLDTPVMSVERDSIELRGASIWSRPRAGVAWPLSERRRSSCSRDGSGPDVSHILPIHSSLLYYFFSLLFLFLSFSSPSIRSPSFSIPPSLPSLLPSFQWLPICSCFSQKRPATHRGLAPRETLSGQPHVHGRSRPSKVSGRSLKISRPHWDRRAPVLARPHAA